MHMVCWYIVPAYWHVCMHDAYCTWNVVHVKFDTVHPPPPRKDTHCWSLPAWHTSWHPNVSTLLKYAHILCSMLEGNLHTFREEYQEQVADYMYLHYTHIYISLLRYLVPHHCLLIPLTDLLRVHLRFCSRAVLCGKRKEKFIMYDFRIMVAVGHNLTSSIFRYALFKIKYLIVIFQWSLPDEGDHVIKLLRKKEVWSNGVWICTFHSVQHDNWQRSTEHVYEHKLTPFLSLTNFMAAANTSTNMGS